MVFPKKNRHADEDRFRAWLLKKLTTVNWSREIPKGEVTHEELAERLGVQVGILKEAMIIRQVRDEARGRPARSARSLHIDYMPIRVATVPAIQADWNLVRDRLRVQDGALLRSLIHHFLQHPQRPKRLSPKYVYRGVVYKNPPKLYRLVTRIPRGAAEALDVLASRWNATRISILKGVITEFLEGRIERFQVVAFKEMWGDPDRYLHPERFQKIP